MLARFEVLAWTSGAEKWRETGRNVGVSWRLGKGVWVFVQRGGDIIVSYQEYITKSQEVSCQVQYH